jgi:hypothetical protein
VPPPILRLIAGTLGAVKPEIGRQARAALILDRIDLTHDAAAIHETYPCLPSTPLSMLLSRGAQRLRAHG